MVLLPGLRLLRHDTQRSHPSLETNYWTGVYLWTCHGTDDRDDDKRRVLPPVPVVYVEGRRQGWVPEVDGRGTGVRRLLGEDWTGGVERKRGTGETGKAGKDSGSSPSSSLHSLAEVVAGTSHLDCPGGPTRSGLRGDTSPSPVVVRSGEVSLTTPAPSSHGSLGAAPPRTDTRPAG